MVSKKEREQKREREQKGCFVFFFFAALSLSLASSIQLKKKVDRPPRTTTPRPVRHLSDSFRSIDEPSRMLLRGTDRAKGCRNEWRRGARFWMSKEERDGRSFVVVFSTAEKKNGAFLSLSPSRSPRKKKQEQRHVDVREKTQRFPRFFRSRDLNSDPERGPL